MSEEQFLFGQLEKKLLYQLNILTNAHFAEEDQKDFVTIVEEQFALIVLEISTNAFFAKQAIILLIYNFIIIIYFIFANRI